jgi:aspartate/methionine/tyrosine aminotransferase
MTIATTTANAVRTTFMETSFVDNLAVFSRRLPTDRSPNAFALARAQAGPIVHDLTASNPTACGIDYPPDLLAGLSGTAGLTYRPDPLGLRSAREAVAGEYAARGLAVDPDRIVLTASSSEAYGFLFKLLCDPGDAVLVPTPSYPLFEHLAMLDGVRAIPYPLELTQGWRPRPLDRAAWGGARAAILVHPNNPTGSFVDGDAAEALAPGLPLIVDEVFLDYAWSSTPRSFAARSHALTFTLGGLSKSRGLPQLKLSWIVVQGPAAETAATMEALEFIGDSYLSVATPVQAALPDLLRRSVPVREAIRSRCLANLRQARALVPPGAPVDLLEPAGGWTAVIRFPRVVSEEALTLELLGRHGVAVYPGFFFDFPAEGFLVISLLPEPASFDAGLRCILDAIEARIVQP